MAFVKFNDDSGKLVRLITVFWLGAQNPVLVLGGGTSKNLGIVGS